MLRRITLSLLILSLANCGRNVSQGPAAKQSSPQPAPTTQQPAPSSAPVPTAFKWTDEELSENTLSCAEAGATEYSLQSWKTFCRCTYEEAARRWTFNDFRNNFETRYDSLFDDGVINRCLDKAGIGLD